MDRLVNLLGALSLRIADEMRRGAENAVGRGAAAPAAVTAISRRRGESMTYLQRALRLSQPATVRVVDRLTEDGYVRRVAGDDKRSVRPLLTRQGAAVAARCNRARADVLRDRLDRLTQEQQASLLLILELLLRDEPRDLADATHLCRLCDIRACRTAGLVCPVDAGLGARA